MYTVKTTQFSNMSGVRTETEYDMNNYDRLIQCIGESIQALATLGVRTLGDQALLVKTGDAIAMGLRITGVEFRPANDYPYRLNFGPHAFTITTEKELRELGAWDKVKRRLKCKTTAS